MLTLTKTIAANGSVICRLEGELDRFTEDQLRGDLAEVVTPVRLVIDLSRILCYDTVGLAALKDVLQKIQDLGGRASVACDAPALSRLLSESGFERVATVHDTIEGAVASPEMTRPVEEQGNRPWMTPPAARNNSVALADQPESAPTRLHPS